MNVNRRTNLCARGLTLRVGRTDTGEKAWKGSFALYICTRGGGTNRSWNDKSEALRHRRVSNRERDFLSHTLTFTTFHEHCVRQTNLMERNSRASRLSVYPKHGPRESVWAGSADLYRSDNNAVCSPFLRECVMAMEDCCDEVFAPNLNLHL